MDRELELATKIWAKPAVTPADVVLRGEMAFYHENGVMEELNNPNAYYCERSHAQLIAAVISVWGHRYA